MLLILVNIAGWLGMALLLGAYALLTLKKLKGDGWIYQLMNLLGGLCLAGNSLYFGALPVACLNFAWFVIGIFGFVSARRKRLATEAEAAA